MLCLRQNLLIRKCRIEEASPDSQGKEIGEETANLVAIPARRFAATTK
jgi:hypothetical protein